MIRIDADLVAASAAAISMMFAGLTYYWSFHGPQTPFAPSVSAGTPLLRETNGVLSVVLSAEITNEGDVSGCIADLALRVESTTAKTRWHLFPAWRVDAERYLAAVSRQEDVFTATQGLISPVKLPGKSSHQHVLLFLPRSPKGTSFTPLGLSHLVAGEKYSFSIHALQGGSDCEFATGHKFESRSIAEFVLERHHLQHLEDGEAVAPLDSERDAARERFIGG